MNFPIAPPQASEHAKAYDALFYTITALMIVFMIIVYALILYFAIKYRKGSSADRRNPMGHSSFLEGLMIVIPTVLALAMFFWSATNYLRYRTMPKDGVEIYVIGKRWMWHVQHANGIRENNRLTVPVDTPITLTMISQDVIHSFYIPEFRSQYHVVPGRFTNLQFRAVQPGTYRLLCAMHCGTQHSEMVGQVVVLPKREYEEWLSKGGNQYASLNETMVEAGARIWNEKGCGNCHEEQDNQRAPSLRGVAGSLRPLTDGSQVRADREYLREAIRNPWDRLTAGYNNTMPTYAKVLSEEQTLSLIEYVRSMSRFDDKGNPVGEYKQPERSTNAGGVGRNRTPVDSANDRASAGAGQFQQLRETP